jgi:LacI family transcriptional regulator
MPRLQSSHVTLRDVAKLSGVSIKTVSRVVNQQGEISESTRRRVQAAIERSGYRPNILARSLVNRRTDTLAVVAWGIDYYGPSRTVVGVEQQANELGYSLMLNLLPEPDHTDVSPILDLLTARRVDGIVWAVPEVGDNRTWISRNRLKQLPPTVFLSTQSKPGLATISVDNRLGAAQATKHLIDHGRRTIGLITGPMAWWEARERYEGWKETLLQASIKPDQTLVTEGDWSAAGGEIAMRKLLAQRPDIDAVFACNDQMALSALLVAQTSGRRVPEDLAIVGFDNMPESAYFGPPLTTIYQHLIDVGRAAVKVLHEIIEARRQGKDGVGLSTTILSPELVIRQSSRSTLKASVETFSHSDNSNH